MLWDFASTQQMHVVIEHGGPVAELIDCIVFSGTGHQFAFATGRGDMWIFDTQSKGLIAFKSASWGIILSMSFLQDDQQLAIGTGDGLIYFWGLQSEESGIELRGHTMGVRCIAYSPCGEWIASGSQDKTVRVWRRRQPPGVNESWSCVSTVHGFLHDLLDIAWNPTVPMEFVTGCMDESVRVWRVSSDGEGVVVKLLWGTNLAVLYAYGLVLKGTIGLSPMHKKLLVQCGAMDDSVTEGEKQDDYTDSERVESDDYADFEFESDDE